MCQLFERKIDANCSANSALDTENTRLSIFVRNKREYVIKYKFRRPFTEIDRYSRM